MLQNTAAAKGESGRRTERILLRIPIAVLGKGAGGKPFREKTHTLVINRHGASILMKHELQPGDRVEITNLQNQRSAPFRVVGKVGNPLGEGPEWAVECLDPKVSFWDIFFPE